MKSRTRYLVTLGLIFSAALSLRAVAKECELDNRYHQAMGEGELTYTLSDGTQTSIIVKVANTNATRAAGFQYVCESVIAERPILFLFKKEIQARFHMRNVVAPIDIAFIKKDGSLDSIQQMFPYSLVQIEKPLYSSAGLIIAALETYPGFFEEQGIDEGTHFEWHLFSARSLGVN